MSDELIPQPARALPAKLDSELVLEMDEVFEQYQGSLARTDLTQGARTMVTAIATLEVRAFLARPEMLKMLRALENTPMGFRTDEKRYSDDVIVDACTEAILRGLSLVGNHFNIIADRFYCAQAGFAHLVAPLAKYGLSFEVEPISDQHRAAGGHVKVKVIGFYARRGNGDEKPEKFTPTYNVRMTKKNRVAEENAEGKARRKFLRDVYAKLTGNELGEADMLAATNGTQAAPAPSLAITAETLVPTTPGQRWEAAKASGPDAGQGDDKAVTPSQALVIRLKDAGLLDDVLAVQGPPPWNEADIVEIEKLLPDE